MGLRNFTTAMEGLPKVGMRQLNLTTSGTPATAAAVAVSIANTTLLRSVNVITGTAQATFTATAAHHLADGQQVAISGCTGVGSELWNGNYTIKVLNATQFQYTMPRDPGLVAGTPVASYTPMCQWAIIEADSANSDTILFGADVNANFHTLAAGDSYELKCVLGAGGKLDLTDLYFKSASASQAFRILFI